MNVLAKPNGNVRGQSSPFCEHLHQYLRHKVSYQGRGFYLCHVGYKGTDRMIDLILNVYVSLSENKAYP